MLLSVEEAKQYLRIDHSDDDALIAKFVDIAHQFATAYTGVDDLTDLDAASHPALSHGIACGVVAMYDAGVDADIIEVMAPYLDSYRNWGM